MNSQSIHEGTGEMPEGAGATNNKLTEELKAIAAKNRADQEGSDQAPPANAEEETVVLFDALADGKTEEKSDEPEEDKEEAKDEPDEAAEESTEKSETKKEVEADFERLMQETLGRLETSRRNLDTILRNSGDVDRDIARYFSSLSDTLESNRMLSGRLQEESEMGKNDTRRIMKGYERDITDAQDSLRDVTQTLGYGLTEAKRDDLDTETRVGVMEEMTARYSRAVTETMQFTKDLPKKLGQVEDMGMAGMDNMVRFLRNSSDRDIDDVQQQLRQRFNSFSGAIQESSSLARNQLERINQEMMDNFLAFRDQVGKLAQKLAEAEAKKTSPETQAVGAE